MITACVVLLPGMEPVLECMLEGLQLNSSLISKVLVAVRTQEQLVKIDVVGSIQVEYFPFWFDKGPTPAGNVQWKGRGYSHAVGLHKCLERVQTEYVLLTEPDVVFIKKDFDKFFLHVIKEHNLSIIGVTRAADPRGRAFFDQQAIGGFPTVIACLVKKESLPPPDYLEGKLKLRPHAFANANTEEDSYEKLDGAWLLQGAIPEHAPEFPKPDGAYPVGCNLYLWFKNKAWLSFHQPHFQPGFYNATTSNLNNFDLSSDYYGEEPLLFHSGHGGLIKLKQCLEWVKESRKKMETTNLNLGFKVEVEYAKNLDHTLRTILLQKWPYRSPFVYTEAVKDIIKDKVVCDIGCAEGDQLAMFSKYAKKVIGIEIDHDRAKPAIERGFEIILGSYKDLGIPEADVYFSWIGPEEDAIFVDTLAKTGRKATSLLFCRKGNHVKDLVEKWGGRLIEFDYKEPYSDLDGFAKEGKAWAGVIEFEGKQDGN